jgi:hypothetical protein
MTTGASRDWGWVRTYLVPIAVFLVVTVVLSALVLSGTVQGQAERDSSGEAPTTVSTVIIVP